jgi:hypothetical protein
MMMEASPSRTAEGTPTLDADEEIIHTAREISFYKEEESCEGVGTLFVTTRYSHT